MEQQAKQDLKKWANVTVQAKIMELEAIKRFILRHQKAEGFIDMDLPEHKDSDRVQGFMSIDCETWDGKPDMPKLYVNVDEVNVFDDQQELFEELFEIEFPSDKMITITGIKL